MERLTEKNDYELTQKEYPYKGLGLNSKIFEKLGILEDLEEQIGMPLEAFYKCITHNEESFLIIEMNDDSGEFEIIEVFKVDEYMHSYSSGKFMFCGYAYDTNENYYEMSFDNYGKDLFLTYEEAKKKLEEINSESI